MAVAAAAAEALAAGGGSAAAQRPPSRLRIQRGWVLPPLLLLVEPGSRRAGVARQWGRRLKLRVSALPMPVIVIRKLAWAGKVDTGGRRKGRGCRGNI